MMTAGRRGECLCGAVQYRTTGPMRPIVACHCIQCRKTSGHYVAATSVRRDHITITGEVRWYKSSNTARRGFCPTCGSQLFWDGNGVNLSIFAGTLNGDTQLQIAGHIYCAYKGDYYDIPDTSAQADADDPNMTTQVVE